MTDDPMHIRITGGPQPIGQDPELPPDPDWDDVPPELAAMHGATCIVDGDTPSIIVIPASLFAASRRLREDLDDAA